MNVYSPLIPFIETFHPDDNEQAAHILSLLKDFAALIAFNQSSMRNELVSMYGYEVVSCLDFLVSENSDADAAAFLGAIKVEINRLIPLYWQRAGSPVFMALLNELAEYHPSTLAIVLQLIVHLVDDIVAHEFSVEIERFISDALHNLEAS